MLLPRHHRTSEQPRAPKLGDAATIPSMSPNRSGASMEKGIKLYKLSVRCENKQNQWASNGKEC